MTTFKKLKKHAPAKKRNTHRIPSSTIIIRFSPFSSSVCKTIEPELRIKTRADGR